MLYISPSTPANLIHVKRISNITVTIFLFFMIFIFFLKFRAKLKKDSTIADASQKARSALPRAHNDISKVLALSCLNNLCVALLT